MNDDLMDRAGAAAEGLEPDDILDVICFLLWIAHYKRHPECLCVVYDDFHHSHPKLQVVHHE